MKGNTSRTTTSPSCVATLSADSRYRTCQACREGAAASRHRRRAEQEEQEGNPVRRRRRPRVEPSQTIHAAYISQLSRLRPLNLGRMDKECPHCHALHWIDERQETSSMRNPNCTDTQGRHFKDNIRQYNAAFAFTSLGCDIVSAEDRANSNSNNSNNNNNRSGLNAFQIHGALCHRHGLLAPVGGIVPSYAQLYIYDLSHDAQGRSERNENLDNEIIKNLSTVLAQYSPFARIYRHVYEVLDNHESPSINSDDKVNNSESTESEPPYIIISPSMRMRLIEGIGRRA
ncbi:hypothetical protein RMCBS344292_11908 [Rhizopus microsporus]|nr:hypothetical protein RMCBS344292_11908 [Rhizopus microsporus]